MQHRMNPPDGVLHETLISQTIPATNIIKGAANGSVTFSKSTEYFADRNLGDGAEIDLLVLHRGKFFGDEWLFEMPVVIEWLDWNRFLWRKDAGFRAD